jgi:hypothetical protein
MKLTKALLNRLEESQRIFLTPEQRLILLHWYGHEPRHGWDEDDFVLGIHEVIQFYPDHRPKRGVDIELPPRLMKERKAFVWREAAGYLKSTDMTPDERKEVLDWVKAGESVRENPWLMTDDDGYPLDYLTAKRVDEELRERHFGCSTTN